MRFSILSIIAFFVLFSLVSCEYKTISFRGYDKIGTKFYQMKVPGGYHLTSSDQYERVTNYYKYKDSSIIFLTSMDGGLDIKEMIDKYGSSISGKLMASNSLTVEGVTESGLYWKQRKLDKIAVGYLHVQESKKALFDSIINSAIRQ